MDDQLLLNASPAELEADMALFKRLGVDRLRVSAFWNQVSPTPDARTKPAGFDLRDHTSGLYNFAELDRVVNSAVRHGLRVMISISTPAPVWASAEPEPRQPAVEAARRPVRRVHRRRGPALRGPRRPLGHLQRAQPGRLAAAPERPLRPGGPPPVPGHGAGRLPAHQGDRPHLHRAGRRAGRQRALRPRRHAADPAAAVPARDGLPRLALAAASGAGAARTSSRSPWTRWATTRTTCSSGPRTPRRTSTTRPSGTGAA